MVNKTKRDVLWEEAKKKCRLDEQTLRMAKEMGLSPLSLIKNIPNRSQPWKLPVSDWIHEMYRKRQEKSERKKTQYEKPQDQVMVVRNAPVDVGKTQCPDISNGLNLPIVQNDRPQKYALHGIKETEPEFQEESYLDDLEEEWLDYRPPTSKEIEEENRLMIIRQKNFQCAAKYVAAALAKVSSVCRVVLFGSVARPLQKEVPPFRKFRKAGIAIWHQCKDVDLAVWVNDISCLPHLRKIKAQVLNHLYRETKIGVAHHQVDIFIMEPGTNRYLGRLCHYNSCPKGKPECEVPGCGLQLFLQQHKDFVFKSEALHTDQSVLLYDRDTNHRETEEFS